MNSEKVIRVYGAGSATSRSAGWRYIGEAKTIQEGLEKYPDATFMSVDPGTPLQRVVWTQNHGVLANEYAN